MSSEAPPDPEAINPEAQNTSSLQSVGPCVGNLVSSDLLAVGVVDERTKDLSLYVY